MPRRIKYNIGDLILIPIAGREDKLVGRILAKDEATVLIEVFTMEPIMAVSEFDYEKVKLKKRLVTEWCYDSAIKRGEWGIISNELEPLTNYGGINYWTLDANGKFYLVKGTDKVDGEYTGIEISREEVSNCNPYGIGSVTSLPIYISKLLEKRKK
ncbi:hypothetical protein [Paenibacillus sp. OV219]|uniref:hypothetical protein n=1 Tax=Paenibacillus sp. OV219 TaxID=1884377 RepID=UPI0008D249C6|nr:hypothetical protein [Paenibacillus sp. OV219]SEO40860.1 Immunity protein 26 [Paenibacillus sp. OV219]